MVSNQGSFESMRIKCPSACIFPPPHASGSDTDEATTKKAAILVTIRQVLACEEPTATWNGQIICHDGKYPTIIYS
jgi:hypothetical protein